MASPLRPNCRPRPTALFNAGWNAGFDAGFNAACDAMFDDIFNQAYEAAIEAVCRDLEGEEPASAEEPKQQGVA